MQFSKQLKPQSNPIENEAIFCNSAFYLRPIVECDTKTLFHWRTDCRISKYLTSPPHRTMKDQKKWFDYYCQNEQSLYFMVFKYSDRSKAIGYCQLFDFDSQSQSAELGIVIGDPHSLKNGLGYKLGVSFLKICFQYLGLLSVYGSNHPDNIDSNKFHCDFIRSELITGKCKYRHGNQSVYRVTPENFSIFTQKITTRSNRWGQYLSIEKL